MRIGCHTSIAGGLHNAAIQAKELEAEVMQIFCKNQRQWSAKPLEDEDVVQFQAASQAANLGPTMVHDSYLINLGSPEDEKRAKSRAGFEHELERCEQLGVAYLNFHPGSHTAPGAKLRDDGPTRRAALDRIADEVLGAMDAFPSGRVRLVIENAAGQGTNVGTSWEEVGYLADAIGNDGRTGVCVDTQHAWACGYDWVEHYDEVWDHFDDQVGLRRLVALHLNDSKSALGSRVDRHDPIGDGHLGAEVFERLVQDPRLSHCAGYLETPGGPEGWKKEIAMLKAWRDGSPS